jgi:aryl-phospho-beta-D-glucosidase BglC (GH1 family)
MTPVTSRKKNGIHVFRLFLSILATAGLWQPSPAAEPAMHSAYKLDPFGEAARSARLPAGAEWIRDEISPEGALRLTVTTADKDATNLVSIPVDLRAWRGSRVRIVGEVKADGVTAPAKNYNGIKCQLHWKSPSNGPRWLDQGAVHGTFDWRELSAVAEIDEDASTGSINLGLQESAGTVWIRNVRIEPLRIKPLRPAPVPEDVTIYRGHDLPRLRGVMSATSFRLQDFEDMKKININLVRWQLTTGQWGKVDTDLDLYVYDRWLEAKLDETQLVLDAALANGIKIVIDLHTPPGGRTRDRTLRIFLEPKYQDNFVALWEKIARRFAGHPALWAYDLINEPLQMRPSPPGVTDYLGTQERAARAVRAIDPTTAISITCDQWSAPDAFAFLKPIDVPNVIYQVHMYWPGEFTHQGVFNAWGVENGDATLAYPGVLNGRSLDKEALRRRLQPVREFQRAYGVHIYVGEFGTIRWSPGGARYLDDCIELFEEYGWDWSYHAFREWPGWSFEHEDLPYSMNKHTKAQTPTEREKVMRKWFDKNLHP